MRGAAFSIKLNLPMTATLPNLTHLSLRLHEKTDPGRLFPALSGRLPSLTFLDLAIGLYGDFTSLFDDQIQHLVTSGLLANLEELRFELFPVGYERYHMFLTDPEGTGTHLLLTSFSSSFALPPLTFSSPSSPPACSFPSLASYLSVLITDCSSDIIVVNELPQSEALRLPLLYPMLLNLEGLH